MSTFPYYIICSVLVIGWKYEWKTKVVSQLSAYETLIHKIYVFWEREKKTHRLEYLDQVLHLRKVEWLTVHILKGSQNFSYGHKNTWRLR